MRRLAVRISAGALAILLLATLAFLLAHALPGGPAYAILGLRATPDRQGALDLQLGLDVPVWQQYQIWLRHLLHGDFGTSFAENRPVADILPAYAANSLLLSAAGLLGAVALALPFGLAHGLTARRLPGRVLGAIELAFYALPGFVIGTALIAIFSGWLDWLPASGDADLRRAVPSLADRARHLLLPAATIALFSFAPLARYVALATDEALASPFVRAARARGAGPAAVLFRHALPHALRPLVTMLGVSFAGFVSGTIAVETVFGYPGLGWLLWRAVLGRDYPVIVAIVLIGGVVTLIATLVADLCAGWLDPRAGFE